MPAPDAFAPLRRGSTAEEVASILRERIMTGALPPGHQLREEALSAQFDVSRRTVHEALAVLTQERIVSHFRHKGFRVVQFTEADIRDLYTVRRSLEVTAAELAKRTSDERLDRLGAAFDNLREATRRGRPQDVVARDLEFHQAVVGLIGSARLDDSFALIAVEMRYALSILESAYRESALRPKEALEEHRRILAAFVDRDVRVAKRLVREHADANEALLIAALGSRD
jgi:DNA-binding GntR family transcriptional regulator